MKNGEIYRDQNSVYCLQKNASWLRVSEFTVQVQPVL